MEQVRVVRILDAHLGADVVDEILAYARLALWDTSRPRILSINNTDWWNSWDGYLRYCKESGALGSTRRPPAYWVWLGPAHPQNEDGQGTGEMVFLGDIQDGGCWVCVKSSDEPRIKTFLRDHHLPC